MVRSLAVWLSELLPGGPASRDIRQQLQDQLGAGPGAGQGQGLQARNHYKMN